MTPEMRWSHLLPPAKDEYTTFTFPPGMGDLVTTENAQIENYFSKSMLRHMKEMLCPSPTHVIKIFRDLDENISPKVESRDGMNFEIHLSRTQYKSTMFTDLTEDQILAHELGHIVGTICKLPASENDWRTHSKVLPKHEGEIESEIEAWDTARLIMLAAFEKVREEAIESYRIAQRERVELKLREAMLGNDIFKRWSSPFVDLSNYRPGEE